MRIEHKKSVFFDLDHTLWDFEKNSALAFDAVFKMHNINVNISHFLEKYIPTNVLYWKLFREDKVTQQQMRYRRLREPFDSLGYAISDEQLELLSADYITHLPQYNHLFDGAVEVLEYLKPKYSLHIITNGFNDIQESKIRNSNIGHYFTTVTNSDMAGCKKPNPLIFEYALKAACADKTSSIMIGDCIEADVQGALNCGIDAIYFNEHRYDAHHSITQINHLLELKNLL